MKKTGLFILSFLVLLSINSCSDSEDVQSSDTKIQQSEKKQRILEKFKELGLDPSKVTFTDTIDKNNNVRVESIDDLENSLKIINQLELGDNLNKSENNVFLNNTKSGKLNSINNGMDYEWDSFSKTVPVPGSFMDFWFAFSYNRALLDIKDERGLREPSSSLIGLTLGFSYSQENYTVRFGGGTQVQFTINGILNYNLFVEGIGTVYSRPITCIGVFVPTKYNYGVGQFLVRLQ